MSQLNWQNVAAPDFGNSLQGFAQFSQLLNQGIGAAQKGLATYNQDVSDESSKAAIADALTYTDPAKFNSALQDGSFFAKHPTANLDAATLASLGKRSSDILDYQNKGIVHDTGTEQLKTLIQKDGWDLSDHNTAEAIKPLYSAMAQASADNTAAGGNADTLAKRQQVIMDGARASGALNGASGDQIAALYSLGNKIATGNQDVMKGAFEAVGAGLHNTREIVDTQNDRLAGIETGVRTSGLRIGNASAADALVNNRTDRKAEDDANLAMQSLLPASKNQETFRIALQNLKQSLSPRAYGLVVGKASQQFGGSVFAENPSLAAVAQAPSGGAAPGGSNYDAYRQGLESGGNPNAAAGTSSATGIDQFTTKTWIDTVKATNPAWARGLSNDQILAQRTNPSRSAEMESALRASNIGALTKAGLPTDDVSLYAMHHFGAGSGKSFVAASGNTPISAILSPQQIAANPYLKGLTKAQAVDVWNKRAARFGVIPGGGGSGFSPSISASQESSQRGATYGTDRVNAANSDTQKSAIEAVNELIGNKDNPGSFSKTDPKILLGRIRDITQRSVVDGKQTISNAAAAKIVEDALAPMGSFQFGPGNLGNGMKLDETQINNSIERARHGTYGDNQQIQAASGRTAAILEAAAARAANSNAALEQLQRDAATRGPAYIALNKDRIIKQAADDAARYRATQAAAGVNPARVQEAPDGSGWLDTLSSFFNAAPNGPNRNPNRASYIR